MATRRDFAEWSVGEGDKTRIVRAQRNGIVQMKNLDGDYTAEEANEVRNAMIEAVALAQGKSDGPAAAVSKDDATNVTVLGQAVAGFEKKQQQKQEAANSTGEGI